MIFQGAALVVGEAVLNLSGFQAIKRVAGRDGACMIVGMRSEGEQECLAAYVGEQAEADSRAAFKRLVDSDGSVIDLTRNAVPVTEDILGLFAPQQVQIQFRDRAEMEATMRLAQQGLPEGEKPDAARVRQALDRVRSGAAPVPAYGPRGGLRVDHG